MLSFLQYSKVMSDVYCDSTLMFQRSTTSWQQPNFLCVGQSYLRPHPMSAQNIYIFGLPALNAFVMTLERDNSTGWASARWRCSYETWQEKPIGSIESAAMKIAIINNSTSNSFYCMFFLIIFTCLLYLNSVTAWHLTCYSPTLAMGC